MKQKLLRRNFFKKSLLATFGILYSGKMMNAGSTFQKSLQSYGNAKEQLNETLKTIQDLHTTHGNFLNKEIPHDQIELIKELCINAANSFNMQTYSVIGVSDRNMMSKLCGYQGSYMMLFCVDYNRLITVAGSLGITYYPDNMTNFTTASINTSLVAQTATIAARSLGIDSLLTNGIHRGDMERLWKLLKLPEKYCFPLIALVLGYTDREPDQKVGRLKGISIFHDEQYHTFAKDELADIVSQYDDPSLNIGLNPGWKDAGHNHYLEWLHKVRLQANINPTEKETSIFTFLKKTGFVDLQGV